MSTSGGVLHLLSEVEVGHDESGLGGGVQIISVLMHLLRVREREGKHFAHRKETPQTPHPPPPPPHSSPWQRDVCKYGSATVCACLYSDNCIGFLSTCVIERSGIAFCFFFSLLCSFEPSRSSSSLLLFHQHSACATFCDICTVFCFVSLQISSIYHPPLFTFSLSLSMPYIHCLLFSRGIVFSLSSQMPFLISPPCSGFIRLLPRTAAAVLPPFVICDAAQPNRAVLWLLGYSPTRSDSQEFLRHCHIVWPLALRSF